MKKITLLFFVFVCSSQLFAQSWGANLSGGYSFTTGEFKDFYDNGLHGSVAGFYNIGSGLQVSLITGYSSWSIKKDYFNEQWKANNPTDHPDVRKEIDVEAPISAIPLMLGFKYFIGKSKKIKPYLMLAAGFTFISTELSGTISTYVQDKQNPEFTESVSIPQKTLNEATLGFGGGMSFPLNKKFALDVNAIYNLINDSEAIQDLDTPSDASLKERTLSYVSIMVGLDYKF